FENTPWNIAGGARPPTIVSDPALVRDGKYAVGMTIPGPSTGDGICCGTRSELQPKIGDIFPGDDLYFGFSTLLGQGFPTDSFWQVITQWKHHGDGSPPLELDVDSGVYQISGGFGHPEKADPFRLTIGPAIPGQWVDWVFHIKFSPDPNTGYI